MNKMLSIVQKLHGRCDSLKVFYYSLINYQQSWFECSYGRGGKTMLTCNQSVILNYGWSIVYCLVR